MGINAFLMGAFFDFYYDLNDDTMMRDIMSGVYSGTPDGHNMQTLYPLGAAIALCYRIGGSFPWYGGFLFLCQFGCFFAVGVRLCALADVSGAQRLTQAKSGKDDCVGTWRRVIGKLLSLLAAALFQWGIWLTHMVNIQYTITCGMLAGTAVFLFLTAPDSLVSGEASGGLPAKAFPRRNIPPLLFFLLAFQLRSEMALLAFPFLGLAGAFVWWEEWPLFTRNNLKKYGGLLLLLLAGMGLSLGADALAYGGEWRTFRQLFDDRTTIYDFYQEVVTEDDYAADLEGLGVSSAAQTLLRNYNFGLDDEIDASLLSDVAAYAKERVGGARDWGAIFKEKFLLYRYRSLHKDDAPYNLLVLFGYAANIIAAVIPSRGKQRKFLNETLYQEAGSCGRRDCSKRRTALAAAAQLFLIFLVRSALWMFILMRGRDPERITHSLYLMEFCLLAGLFLRRLWREGAVSVRKTENTSGPAFVPESAKTVAGAEPVQETAIAALAAAVCLLAAVNLVKAVPAVRADQIRRQEINAGWEAIDVYCRAHPDAFYFEDVYSTVAFSGKLLERRDNALANYDIAGGWMCKSPLYWEKLSAFGIEEAAEALAEGKAYFILSDEEKELRGLNWLTEFYAQKGAKVEEQDRIGESYGVYQVIPISQ